jgi:hypothetical protein
VLQTAALGGNGPGTLAQLQLPVPSGQLNEHVFPLMLHVPTLGQLAVSTPGVVQAAPVSAQVPLVAGHWLSLLHALPLLLHLPAFGQSCGFRHSVVPSEQRPLPQSVVDAQSLALLLLQVPIVRQLRAAMQALPFLGPDELSHVPFFCGHWLDEPQLLNVHLDEPGKLLQSLFARHGVALSWHRPTLHVPLPRVGQSVLLVHDVELLLQRPFVPVQVAAEKQASPEGLAHVPGQS